MVLPNHDDPSTAIVHLHEGGRSESKQRSSLRTIYSCDDEAERAALKVPLQVDFTGPSNVLSSHLANTLLTELGMQGVLSRMNTILETNHTISPTVEVLLQFCLDSFEDFGQAYALLRPRWEMDPAQALEDIRTCQEHDRELRASAIEDNIIVNPNCPPRRIWDLWSNRAVPLWMTTPFQGERSKTWFAVSHSWMSENLRRTVETPINGYEWPVPIPTETTLERVRVELLNYASKLNVNLVWLDVLCLRQAGAQANEGLRIAEWRLDVPTIGEVYPEAYRTVYYYSGLGLPFEAKEFDSPRHWQNRAWTLQETNPSRIVGGCSPLSPSMPGVDTRNLPVGEAIRPMYDKIDVWESFSHVADSIFTVLEAMRHRSATNELDKVAGLNYYLAKFSPLPAYVVGDDPENAWNRIVKATHPMQRADLFFLFPEPGNGKHVWCPSWQQIKDAESLPKRRTLRKYVNLDEDCDSYSFSGYCLERCWLEGLSVIGDPGSVREGRISLVSTRGEAEDIIPVAANHSIILEDGYYTLIGGDWIDQWVLVRRTESGLYCKLSVIQIRGGDGSIRKMCSKGKGNTEMRLL